MTEQLEELLSTEFRNGPYEMPVNADRLTTTLRRRRSRRNAMKAATAVCGAALAVTAGVGVLNAFGPGSGQSQPAAPGSTTPSVMASQSVAPQRPRPDSVQLGNAVVRGLPAEAKLTDPTQALSRPPILVLPQTGDRAVLYVPTGQSAEIRLVVVVDAKDRPGLPGVVVTDRDWLRSSSLNGARTLLTVDDSTQTTYLSVSTTTGRRWDLAATGPDAAARLDLLRAVIVATTTSN